MLIYCFVYNASKQQCLFALNAGCALTAVVLTSLVARPCLGVVDRELLSASRYGSFRQEGVGCMHLDVSVRALMHSVAHGSDEFLAAVGINMVVASVVGNHHSFEASALRYAMMPLRKGTTVDAMLSALYVPSGMASAPERREDLK